MKGVSLEGEEKTFEEKEIQRRRLGIVRENLIGSLNALEAYLEYYKEPTWKKKVLKPLKHIVRTVSTKHLKMIARL